MYKLDYKQDNDHRAQGSHGPSVGPTGSWGGGAVVDPLTLRGTRVPELLGSFSLRWALDVFTYVPYMTLDGLLGGGELRWALAGSLGVERLLGERWRLGGGLQLHRWSDDGGSSQWRWGPTLTVAYQPFF